MRMRTQGLGFWISCALFLVAVLALTRLLQNEYPFFAGYVILQFMVLATASCCETST